MVNQHQIRVSFLNQISLDLISNWQFLTGWKLHPYRIPVDRAFQQWIKERGRKHCLDFKNYYYFGKISHSLVTTQRGLVPLCRERGCSASVSHKRWCSSEKHLVCPNGSWLESVTHVMHYPSCSTAPKRPKVPVSHGQHWLWWELSFCLSAAWQPVNISPARKPCVV